MSDETITKQAIDSNTVSNQSNPVQNDLQIPSTSFINDRFARIMSGLPNDLYFKITLRPPKAAKDPQNMEPRTLIPRVERDELEPSTSIQKGEKHKSEPSTSVPEIKKLKIERRTSLISKGERNESKPSTLIQNETEPRTIARVERNDKIEQVKEVKSTGKDDIERITLAPFERLSAEQIDNLYPEAAKFIKNNIFILGKGFELLNNSYHIIYNHTKYWRMCTDKEVKIIPKGYESNGIYKCPISPCDYTGENSTSRTNHIRRHHGPVKYMCPFGLPQHVVPVIATLKETIQRHIHESHRPNKKSQFAKPILMHTRQINFPFTIYNKKYTTLAAELCFTKEREFAMDIIKEKGIENTLENRWITLKDLPENYRSTFFVRAPRVLDVAEAIPY